MSGRSFAAAAVLAAAVLGCDGRSPQGADHPPIHFWREHVRVEPSDGRTRVVGVYYFRNLSDEPVETSILYPFPVDRYHMPPFKVRAWQERNGVFQPMGFTRGDAFIRWKTRFAPHEEKVVRVEYVQEIKRNYAIYIVSTTRQWQRPIEVAEFEFWIPRDLRDATLSFEPDRIDTVGDTIVYFVRETDFFPEEDLTVTWGADSRGSGPE